MVPSFPVGPGLYMAREPGLQLVLGRYENRFPGYIRLGERVRRKVGLGCAAAVFSENTKMQCFVVSVHTYRMNALLSGGGTVRAVPCPEGNENWCQSSIVCLCQLISLLRWHYAKKAPPLG